MNDNTSLIQPERIERVILLIAAEESQIVFGATKTTACYFLVWWQS
jgi:hypothetical protein